MCECVCIAQVKAVSASEVPAGIPIVYQAKLQLPRGLYNLTMTVAPLTKGKPEH
jgi:hypothetical protein